MDTTYKTYNREVARLERLYVRYNDAITTLRSHGMATPTLDAKLEEISHELLSYLNTDA